MKTKRILLCLTLLVFMHCYAYSQNEKWTFGIEAGINYSNSTEDTAPFEKKKPILYKVGIELGYSFNKYLFIQSGLAYSAKGLKSKGGGRIGEMNVNGSIDLFQQVLQIPVYLGHEIDLEKSKLSFMAGPYIAYGIGGKTKANGVINNKPFTKEVNTFGDARILDKVDFGIGFGLNYEIRHLYFKAGYELGILNIGHSNIMGGNLDYKNRILSAVIGYRL